MSKPDTGVRTALLSGAAYAGMFVFGIVMALLGAVLPSLSSRLRFEVSDIGTLFLVMNFAMLACSLLLGLAMDRFGMKPPLTLGPVLVGGSLFLMVRASAFADLLPAVALLGLGGGALNGATNTLVADLHDDPQRKSSALNLLGVFFGFGALFLPFGIGTLLATFGIDALMASAGVLCVAVGLFGIALRFPPPKQKQRLPIADMPRLLRSPIVIVTACMLFFQSGVEFTLGGYISTFLTRAAGLDVTSASLVLASYWAALMIARLFLSRIVLGADPHRVVMFCALGACAGAALVALAGNVPLTCIALIFTGLALSGIYPTVLGIVGSHFREHSGTVFGILFTGALTGGMMIPWISGQAAESAGLRIVFVIVSAAFAAIFTLGRVLSRASVRGR